MLWPHWHFEMMRGFEIMRGVIYICKLSFWHYILKKIVYSIQSFRRKCPRCVEVYSVACELWGSWHVYHILFPWELPLGLTWKNGMPFNTRLGGGTEDECAINKQGQLALLPRLQKWGREKFLKIDQNILAVQLYGVPLEARDKLILFFFYGLWHLYQPRASWKNTEHTSHVNRKNLT